jgi:hypothetical protein
VPAAVAAQPEVDMMNSNIKKFVTASKEVPITVCPTTCLNVGSFYGAWSGCATGAWPHRKGLLQGNPCVPQQHCKEWHRVDSWPVALASVSWR